MRPEFAPRSGDDVNAHLRAELARVCETLAALLAGRTALGVGEAAAPTHPAEALRNLAQSWWHGAPLSTRAGEGVRAALDGRADALAASGVRVPLREVRRNFDLTPLELDALLLAVAAEVDGRVVRALSILEGRTRPTLGLALELGGGVDMSLAPQLPARPVFRDGLLLLEGDGPLPTRTLRLEPDVVGRLTDATRLLPDLPGLALSPLEHSRPDRLVMDDATCSRLEAWSRVAHRRPPGKPSTAPVLVLVAPPGSGRRTLARAHAALAGYGLVTVELAAEDAADRLLAGRREARWHDAALLVRLTPGFDPHRCRDLWSGLRDLNGPLVLAVSPQDGPAVLNGAPRGFLPLTLRPPTLAERAALWRALLPVAAPIADDALASLAARFHFGAGGIAKSVERASAEAAATPGSSTPTAPLFASAARALGVERMSALAQRLPTPFTRDMLVLPERTRAELDLALAWVRRSYRVLEEWGLAGRLTLGRGLTALFAGPPGTGKTMAAQVLARELDVELFRVDLSRVMSKYIGETERNLSQLFDEAHASGAALFFDEADALFGKRSETHSAHDRYANVEIGYLLQRMEELEGIAILATNRMGDMDEAFLRRFHVIARFDLPSAGERLRIWEGMLPLSLEREPLPLARVADAFEMSGGDIRNAVLVAAFLAADEGSILKATHLARAVERVLTSAGRVVDPSASLRVFGEACAPDGQNPAYPGRR